MVFSNNQLQITIEANKKVVNFLDVTLDLNKQSYGPFIKPNNKPLYVHRESNPPLTLKNILLAVNRRLNEISSCKESFEEAAPVFQEALRNSGYEYTVLPRSNLTETAANRVPIQPRLNRGSPACSTRSTRGRPAGEPRLACGPTAVRPRASLVSTACCPLLLRLISIYGRIR